MIVAQGRRVMRDSAHHTAAPSNTIAAAMTFVARPPPSVSVDGASARDGVA